MTQILTMARFQKLEKQSFQAHLEDGGTVNLVLEAVNPQSRQPKGFECFSLSFGGPLEPNLLQGTYEIEHDSLGRHPIFLVPAAMDEEGFSYEATFSRRLDESATEG